MPNPKKREPKPNAKPGEPAAPQRGEVVSEGYLVPADYQEFLGAIKRRIQDAQARAALSVNR